MKQLFNLTLLFFFCLLIAAPLQAQHVFSAGPMIHFNFGGGKAKVSYGVEVAYWNVFGLPYGADLGLDFEKSAFRIYTEAQTGLILGGISAGPYIEMKRNTPVKAGLQTSVWANTFLGVNVRCRFTAGKDTFAPGLYGKYLWTPGGKLREEFEEHHPDEGGGWD